MWSEAQLDQLRSQIQAYKHLVSQDGDLDAKCFDKLQLTDNWAFKQQLQHQATMRQYEERFEANRILYFHDLWEYVERKMANQDTAVSLSHPQADV